jgi:enoyl-[acyl-carrier-protein] reductase (NADH)
MLREAKPASPRTLPCSRCRCLQTVLTNTQDEAEQNFLNTAQSSTPINRFATTEEVANLATHESSKQSSGTTGSSLRVDGSVVRSII